MAPGRSPRPDVTTRRSATPKAMSAMEWLPRSRFAIALLTAAAAAGLAFFLRATADVFVPFMVALVIALASHPVVEWLGRKNIPTPVAVGLVVLVSMLAL